MDYIKQQRDYDGVSRWHAAGITGQGIAIWDAENSRALHGQLTHQRVLDAAPDAAVINASLASRTGVKDAVLDDGTRYSVEEFVQRYKIKIITRSVGGNFCTGTDAAYWQDLQRRYNLIILNAAGNEGSTGDTANDPVAILVGACGLYKAGSRWELRRDNYSSTGPGIDFVDFRGDISVTSGTSFSAPYLAGKIALLCQRYGDITQAQAMEYLRDHAEDMDEGGRDDRTGWGLPIMGTVDEDYFGGSETADMIAPYRGRFKVSQAYKGAAHKGLDLVGQSDKTIYSTVAGLVEAARWDSAADHNYGMGQYVRIKDDVTGHRYYFAHLSKIGVAAGQRVQRGQKIGVEGSTGHSTGSHLHYEVRREPDNTTYMDVSAISGIPNRLGYYEAREEEMEDMTEEQVRKIVREELSGAGRPTSDWATPFWADRTADGTVDGSSPQGYTTREQVATMLSKLIMRFGGK